MCAESFLQVLCRVFFPSMIFFFLVRTQGGQQSICQGQVP